MSRTFTASASLALLLALSLVGPSGTAQSAAEKGPPGAQTAMRCVTDTQEPCQAARQYRRAFVRGHLGRTKRGTFSKAFRVKMRKAAVRKGLIPPAGARRVAARGYRYSDWGELWSAFNNALDCVAPGAESSCKRDFDKIEPLKKPAKVVIGCGGLAVVAYYSAGTAVPATAALTGGLTCSWGMAISAW